ncbi:MAG TPA: hypothetical protein VEV83_13125 [Parafilimonas sp.]|nr:hypothetical protein [Parafilimonas sp.]
MSKQRDRHLEAPGEANRDKHINFLAEEHGDQDPRNEGFDENDKEVDPGDTAARNSAVGVDDGLLGTNNPLQTPAEKKHGSSSSATLVAEKTIPLDPDEKETLADKISINKNNDDILTRVTDEQNIGDTNEEDQAH